MTKSKTAKSEPRATGLQIFGADANNLKQVDVHIPFDKVTLVTGISGSGKSSLLADTLAIEANRRTRLFLGVDQKHLDGPPPRAFIGAMPPAIHVGQRAFRASVRTTVATATGLLLTLRRLFLLCARPYSDELQRFIPAPSAANYAAWLVRQHRGKATVWATPVRLTATDGVRCAQHLLTQGVDEVVIRSTTDTPKIWEQGRTVKLAKFKPLNPAVKHIIEANIGSIDISPKAALKKVEALLAQAFEAGQGQVVVELPAAVQPELRGPFGPRLDSALHYVDPELSSAFFQANRHLLSFNSPEHPESGACGTCAGIGRATTLDESALITHPERSMHKGAFSLWTEKNYRHVNIQHETIEGLRDIRGFSPDIAWSKLPEAARRLVLDGADSELITDRDPTTHRKMSSPRVFAGFRSAVMDRIARGTKVSESLSFLVSEGPCPDCHGTRWSSQARALKIDGVGIQELLSQPFSELQLFSASDNCFAKAVPPEARALVRVLHHHASAFVSVGLGHLTGDRGMLAVSEGESRRARLAAVLNSTNAGLCMLLDEPARGLHDEDVENMAGAITTLARAHTVVMNEHRHALVKAADHVIELGPGAGNAGGTVVYEGPIAKSSWAKASTIRRAQLPTTAKTPAITVRGATIHNVQGVNCTIPLGRMTCITGLSGSGKSNFVRGVLVPAVATALQTTELGDFDQRRGKWAKLEGAERLKGMIALDQKPPSPNRRSIAATFLDVANGLRSAFGSSEQARRVGMTPSDFGLNSGSGRCQFCLGTGEVPEHDQWSACPVCGGTRFGQEALSVRVDGFSIGELLDAPITALRARPPACLAQQLPLLTAIVDLGIGHISLGRRVDTLSGGEIQRLRIAAKLAEHNAGDLLFVLDEPAAGLHPLDVELLVRALDRILDGGRNTVVLVEHNAAIIDACDWLIEFGPGSGPRGGKIVAAGTPEQVRKTDTATGRVLSGRKSPARVRPSPPPSLHPSTGDGDLVRQAERVKAWMRHLIGDNVAQPEPETEDAAPERPVAAIGEGFWQGRRLWEIGDLDLELAKLLLDVQLQPVSSKALDDFARAWAKASGSQLAIHPFFKDIQVWGPRLPRSTVKATRGHILAMGLKPIEPARPSNKEGELQTRAVGERFTAQNGSPEERRHLIEQALALGGGYAELRGSKGEPLQSIGLRLVDVKHGIVAPMSPAPFHFSRHDRRGQCAMCTGTGQVMTFKAELVVANARALPEEEWLLHPAAASIMKGVRRSELLPLLKRMSEEGLWDSSVSYERLDPTARDMLLFGCWARPGHGTFLKNSKEDPSEVGAWLRWDGLYRALSTQLERSTDAAWKTAVERSRSERACPACEGTGLAASARLLLLDGRSLQDWVRAGTVGDFCDAIAKLRTSTGRQQRTQQRLVACLAPLAKDARSRRLLDRAEGNLAQQLARTVVDTFTTMPAVFT